MEEGFGACLGAVIARTHLQAASSAQPSLAAAADTGEWEHVSLFDASDPPLDLPALPLATGRRADSDLQSEPPAKRSCTAGGGSGRPAAGAGRHSDKEEALMGAVFRRVRRRMERLRRYNRAGRFREAREQAAAILGAAAPAGCRRLAAQAARLLSGSGYLPAAAVDELEVQLDAAEAIWASGRCVV